MKAVLVWAAAILLTLGPVLSFEGPVADAIAGLKEGDPVPVARLKALLTNSERWCYVPAGNGCSWMDEGHVVDETGASYVLTYGWDGTVVQFDERMTFKNDTYTCLKGLDYVETLSGSRDGRPISTEETEAIKADIRTFFAERAETEFCFDHLFKSASEAHGTITLVQREYDNGVYQSDLDTQLVIHLDPEKSAALGIAFTE